MKIGIVGCGALGSYYGAKLCRDHHDVHFLLRSDYETVRRRGVDIVSPEGNFNARPACARAPEEIGVCDLVLIGLKTTANHQFATLLTPLVGEHTALLTLQNGLGNEEKLAELFGRERVLGGLCFVCLNRLKPGQIQHIAHGRIIMGEFSGWPLPRTHDIASAFRHAGVPCDVTEKLAQAHWEKLVWNIPFNGLGVGSAAGYDAVFSGHRDPRAVLEPCLTTDVLLADSRWAELVRGLMREVIRSAQALGLKVPDSAEETQVQRTLEMGAYKASTLIDFERGHPLELEALFLEPLRQAKAQHVKNPKLEALCNVLVALDGAKPGRRE